jgi:hypothetical protein
MTFSTKNIFIMTSLLLLMGCTIQKVDPKMKNEMIVQKLKEYLYKSYPSIKIEIKNNQNNKIEIYFEDSKFGTLYPTQRYHYLIHHIPTDFFNKYLSNSRWFELAPGENPNELKYPDEKLIKNITPDILKVLNKIGFFTKLDDLMCPINSTAKPYLCKGDFEISKSILKNHNFSQEDLFDIFHVMMQLGGFCDCEILTNVVEESRFKTEAWKKIANDKISTKKD